MNEQEALDKFKLWYVEPVEKLKELSDGAGGFVAFIVGLTLYERLIYSKLKLIGHKTSSEDFDEAMNEDLKLTDYQRKVFWDMFRNGLLHKAMPKLGKTGYRFHDCFTGYPQFVNEKGYELIHINPWKFTDRVLNEFSENPKLILIAKEYPLPFIE